MTQQHLPAGRINPVTYAPMPAETKTVYRVAFYDADHKLVKHQEGWPSEDNPNLQMTADISAASHMGSMGAGTVVVWDNVDIVPPTRLPELAGASKVAWREFGPNAPAVPEYRCEVDSESRTVLMFPK